MVVIAGTVVRGSICDGSTAPVAMTHVQNSGVPGTNASNAAQNCVR
jgi:hypothetical protein